MVVMVLMVLQVALQVVTQVALQVVTQVVQQVVTQVVQQVAVERQETTPHPLQVILPHPQTIPPHPSSHSSGKTPPRKTPSRPKSASSNPSPPNPSLYPVVLSLCCSLFVPSNSISPQMNTIITRQSVFQPEYATLFQQRGCNVRTASETAMIPVGPNVLPPTEDVIVNGREAVAFLFLFADTHTHEELMQRLDAFAKTFTNALLLYVGSTINWSLLRAIQQKQSLRLFFASNALQAVDCIVEMKTNRNCRCRSPISPPPTAKKAYAPCLPSIPRWLTSADRSEAPSPRSLECAESSQRTNGDHSPQNPRCSHAHLRYPRVHLARLPRSRHITPFLLGSIAAIANASLEELVAKVPLDKPTLEAVFRWFHHSSVCSQCNLKTTSSPSSSTTCFPPPSGSNVSLSGNQQ